MIKTTLTILVIIVSFSCTKKQSNTETTVKNGDIPDQEIWDSKVILTSAGKKNAILTAAHISKYEDRKEVLVDGVRVDFYDQDGLPASVLTSKKGKVDETTNNLEAIDSVVVVSSDSIRLETEHLIWDNKKEKIISNVFCKITTNVDTITGVGIESDPNLEHWEIKSRVQGSFKRKVELE